MKNELAKWLLDIAKYVTTGVILATLFSSLQEKRTIFVIATIIVLVTLSVGIYLLRLDEKNSRTINRKRK
jgi:hypothetical protein